jgi:hypothetical protein
MRDYSYVHGVYSFKPDPLRKHALQPRRLLKDKFVLFSTSRALAFHQHRCTAGFLSWHRRSAVGFPMFPDRRLCFTRFYSQLSGVC